MQQRGVFACAGSAAAAPSCSLRPHCCALLILCSPQSHSLGVWASRTACSGSACQRQLEVKLWRKGQRRSRCCQSSSLLRSAAAPTAQAAIKRMKGPFTGGCQVSRGAMAWTFATMTLGAAHTTPPHHAEHAAGTPCQKNYAPPCAPALTPALLTTTRNGSPPFFARLAHTHTNSAKRPSCTCAGASSALRIGVFVAMVVALLLALAALAYVIRRWRRGRASQAPILGPSAVKELFRGPGGGANGLPQYQQARGASAAGGGAAAAGAEGSTAGGWQAAKALDSWPDLQGALAAG